METASPVPSDTGIGRGQPGSPAMLVESCIARAREDEGSERASSPRDAGSGLTSETGLARAFALRPGAPTLPDGTGSSLPSRLPPQPPLVTLPPLSLEALSLPPSTLPPSTLPLSSRIPTLTDSAEIIEIVDEDLLEPTAPRRDPVPIEAFGPKPVPAGTPSVEILVEVEVEPEATAPLMQPIPIEALSPWPRVPVPPAPGFMGPPTPDVIVIPVPAEAMRRPTLSAKSRAAPTVVTRPRSKTSVRWPILLCGFVAMVFASAAFMLSPQGQRPGVQRVSAAAERGVQATVAFIRAHV